MKQWLGVILAAAVLLAGCATSYLPAAFDDVADTAVFIDGDRANGSGTVIGGTLVLTAAHVAEGSKTIKVVLLDGTERNAELEWKSETLDVAVLKIDGDPLAHTAEIDCRPMERGEQFQWIGNPLGLKFNYRRGFVSSTSPAPVEDDLKGVLPVQASFNPGDSGSGVFDMNGRVRGIVSAFVILPTGFMGQSYSQSGIGLMLPASEFCNSMDRLGDGIVTTTF